MFRKCLKTYLLLLLIVAQHSVIAKNNIFLLDILINSNCCEMTDTTLKFLFSVIHVLISAYVLD